MSAHDAQTSTTLGTEWILVEIENSLKPILKESRGNGSDIIGTKSWIFSAKNDKKSNLWSQ
jgi:hypothetical protein